VQALNDRNTVNRPFSQAGDIDGPIWTVLMEFDGQCWQLAGRFHRVLGLPTDFCGDDAWLSGCVIDVIADDWIMIR
jgi:hypothetical protein